MNGRALSPVHTLQVLRRALADPQLSTPQKLVVAVAVASANGKSAECFPAYSRLQEQLGVGRSTISSALRVAEGVYLERAGVGRNGATRYRVITTNGTENASQSLGPDRGPQSRSGTHPVPSVDLASPPAGHIRTGLSSVNSNESKKRSKHRRFDDVAIESIYDAYPRKVAKRNAIKSISLSLTRISKRGEPNPVEWLLNRVRKYAQSRAGEDSKFTPHPATWFNQERYEDEPTEWHHNGSRARVREATSDYGTETIELFAT